MRALHPLELSAGVMQGNVQVEHLGFDVRKLPRNVNDHHATVLLGPGDAVHANNALAGNPQQGRAVFSGGFEAELAMAFNEARGRSDESTGLADDLERAGKEIRDKRALGIDQWVTHELSLP